jgi:hypothetical protein
MRSVTKQQPSHKSLVTKFNLSLLAVYLCSVLIAAPAVYFVTEKEVYDRAQEELTLMVDVVKSIQDYVATDLRPHFLKKIFIIHRRFRELSPPPVSPTT